MKISKRNRRQWIWLAFFSVFSLSLALVAGVQIATTAAAAEPPITSDGFAGSTFCKTCHESIHTLWMTTRHGQAFSSPIFQRDWSQVSQQTSCLECHTTGFDPATGTYAEEGVTCESCHGQFNPGHPEQPMPIKPDADLCSQCHKSTTNEWKASPHSTGGIECQACHNPHSQTPKAPTVTELCGNCHKDMGDSFTHGTHSNAGLECSNCHMYTAPREGDPIMGLVPTGHTFSVGSEACIGCHQDTVHTRDTIIALTGEIDKAKEVSIEEMQQKVTEQEQTINSLKTSATVRLYTGLAQGAIVGLVTGGVAAWVVSRRIRVIEEEENG